MIRLIQISHHGRSKNMKKIIKEYILDSLAYLSVGIWIGAGVAVGFFGITALLIR